MLDLDHVCIGWVDWKFIGKATLEEIYGVEWGNWDSLLVECSWEFWSEGMVVSDKVETIVATIYDNWVK